MLSKQDSQNETGCSATGDDDCGMYSDVKYEAITLMT